VIKYIGSKRTLVPEILRAIRSIRGAGTVIDLFSGTSRVGHALKRAGYRVLANDHNRYAHVIALCYVQADRQDVLRDAEALVKEFNRIPGRPGWFTETYCRKSRFFQPRNGERIDAIRDAIAAKGLAPELEAVLLVSLMEAADRVDSTTGLQMAYLKKWAPRAHNDLELRVPDVLPRAPMGKGAAFRMDAREAARSLAADIAYIDPPYNQHSFLANYHIWESLVLWDKPEVYGVACKRMDCRERKSDFNSRPRIHGALREVIESVKAPVLAVSFNDEGYVAPEELRSLLSGRGAVCEIQVDHKRYVGAQIGIYNPGGVKVGKVGHLRNREFIFVAGPPELIREAESALRSDAGSQGTLFDLSAR